MKGHSVGHLNTCNYSTGHWKRSALSWFKQTCQTFITGTLAYIGWWGNELTHYMQVIQDFSIRVLNVSLSSLNLLFTVHEKKQGKHDMMSTSQRIHGLRCFCFVHLLLIYVINSIIQKRKQSYHEEKIDEHVHFRIFFFFMNPKNIQDVCYN